MTKTNKTLSKTTTATRDTNRKPQKPLQANSTANAAAVPNKPKKALIYDFMGFAAISLPDQLKTIFTEDALKEAIATLESHGVQIILRHNNQVAFIDMPIVTLPFTALGAAVEDGGIPPVARRKAANTMRASKPPAAARAKR